MISLKKIDWLKVFPVLVGVIFSLFFIFYFGINKTEFGDTEDYINGANAFLNGTAYPRVSVFHPMFRPPLFSGFIAIIWLIFPQSIIAVKIFQAILHAATVFVVYKTVYEILRKRIPAFFGALVCAVNPLLLAHTVDFYTEPLHTFLCAAAMLFLAKFLKDESVSYWKIGVSGILFGLSALNRPAILGVAVGLIFVIAILQIRNSNRIKYLIACAVMFFSIFATILPWTIQNYRDTGEFILVNDGFSYNLWLGNLPETIKLYEGNFESKEENQRFADYIWGDVQTAKIAELEKTDNFSSLKINEKEKVWRREALKNMSADYGLTARLMFGKFLAFWTPFLNPYSYGRTITALVAIFVIFTYIFGLFGMFVFSKDKAGAKFVILLLTTFLIHTLIHVIIFGFVRYRVPNVDPYLSMLAGVAVWQIAVKYFPNFSVLNK